MIPMLSLIDHHMSLSKIRRARGRYLYWTIAHAELIINIALSALALGGALEIFEWIRMVHQ